MILKEDDDGDDDDDGKDDDDGDNGNQEIPQNTVR